MNESRPIIRVLIVDDEEPPVREFRHALLQAEETCDFSFVVDWAQTVTEYGRAIKNAAEPYDVLVADLKMTTGETDLRQGIEEVVSWHLIHSPTTIVIVYSVFTSGDRDEVAAAVDTCALAMRAGAANCVRKAAGSSGKLVDSIVGELRQRREPSLVFDSEWWSEHAEDLTRDYAGKAVALRGDQVIAQAETIPELRRLLREHDRSQHGGTTLPRIMLVPDVEE